MIRTPNPVYSCSGSDANMMLCSVDLFGRQHQWWASSPDLVQTMLFKNIHKTITAKMEQEHGIREDRRQSCTDN